MIDYQHNESINQSFNMPLLNVLIAH